MLTEHTHDRFTWIDCVTPTDSDVRTLMEQYDLHPTLAQDMLTRTALPRVDFYPSAVFIVLHFPILSTVDSNEKNQEVNFVITKNALVTIRYDAVESFNVFSKELALHDAVAKEKHTHHPGLVFTHMLSMLYHELTNELAAIDEAAQYIEEEIFAGSEREMVRAISELSRDLLDIHHTIDQHATVLQVLRAKKSRLLSKKVTDDLVVIEAMYEGINKTVKELREEIRELRDTNDSLLSTKQNEVMKILTILAFVTFPLSLIATIFGMNTINTPIIGSDQDFWILVGLMALLTLLMFVWFKMKRWL